MKFNIPRGTLVIKDSPQRPGDDESAREVTISRRKSIRGGGSLQEEAERDGNVNNEKH